MGAGWRGGVAVARTPARDSILQTAFGVLYQSRTLYWLVSTVAFAGRWRVWQRRALPRLVGHDVLEVGCGIGSLLADMVRAGYHCRAVDASPRMVAAARSELRRQGLAGRDVAVEEGVVQRLPFDAAAFDTVVSTFPTPYIYDPAAVREIARVLRPGGRLVVVEGATLLPAHLLLMPLVALQAVVYGQPLRRALARHDSAAMPERAVPAAATTVERPREAVWTELPRTRRSAIPLEMARLRRIEEVDHARSWQVLVVIGEKAASADPTAAQPVRP